MLKARVLIVDKETSFSKLVSKSLEKLRYHVAGTAEYGLTAMKLTEELKPDLILMNTSLKGDLDGLETATLIQKNKVLPVVYIVNREDKDTIEKYSKTDAYGFLLKPFSDFELGYCIKTALLRFHTERKQRESEDRFKALTEVALSTIIIISGEKFIYANPYAKVLTGYDASELVKMNFWDIVHPDSRELVMQRGLARQRGEDVPTTYEFRIITKSGQEKWVQTSAAVMEIDGKPGTLAIVIDITDSKSFQESLKKSRERYRAFIEQSTEGIYRVEARNPIPNNLPVKEQVDMMFSELFMAECNEVMAKMYGYRSAEEIIGKKVSEFLIPEYPENRKMMTDFVTNNYRISESESSELDSRGNTVYFSNNAVGIVEEGKLERIWGTQKDITIRKVMDRNLKENIEYSTILNYFTSSLIRQNTVEEILWDITQNCFSKLSFVDCVIYLKDETGTMLLQKAAYGRKNNNGDIKKDPLNLPIGSGIIGSVAMSGIAEIIPDTSVDPRYLVDDERRLSEITVPIINEGNVIGVIDSEHPEKGFFTDFHLSILQYIASLCSNKIVNAMAQEKVRKSEERYRTFVEQSSEGIYRLEFREPISINLAIEDMIDKLERSTYIAECNDVFARMYCKSRGEELKGKNTNDLKYVNINARERDRKFITMNFKTYEEESIEKDKSGNTFYFVGNAVGVIENGFLTSIWGVQRDVTEKKKSEEILKRSLNEKEILLKEIHHRVKNNLQIVTSLLKLQSSYVKDEKVKLLFRESQNRVKSMALIHQKLYQTKDLSHVNFKEYISTVASHLQHSYGVLDDKVKIEIEVQDIHMSIDNAIPAGLIINELISNSLKHAFPEGRTGRINLSAAFDEFKNEYWFVIRDNGIGIPEDFSIKKSDSFGLKLVSTLVEQMGGNIELVSIGGCEYRISFKGSDYTDRN